MRPKKRKKKPTRRKRELVPLHPGRIRVSWKQARERRCPFYDDPHPKHPDRPPFPAPRGKVWFRRMLVKDPGKVKSLRFVCGSCEHTVLVHAKPGKILGSGIALYEYVLRKSHELRCSKCGTGFMYNREYGSGLGRVVANWLYELRNAREEKRRASKRRASA